MVTGFRMADRVLRDNRFGRNFALSVERRAGVSIMEHQAFRQVGRFLLLMNPPDHTRLRSLLGKAFSVRQAGDLRRLVTFETRRLLRQLRDHEQGDLVSEFNYPLPVAVICALLDLGLQDRAWLARQTSALLAVLELRTLSGEELTAADEAADAFEAFFRAELKQRRMRRGPDLMSRLLEAEQGDDGLTEDEIIANLVLLFLAGHETVANQLGNALLTLFRHPEQLARVRTDARLVPVAVEESLRYEPAVHIAARGATEELILENVCVHRDDTLYINLGSANRDESVFEAPEKFNLDRTEGDAPKGLAFGGGIHYCLGARLARIELEAGLSALVHGLPRLGLLEPEHPRWKTSLTIRGLEFLPAAW